MKIGMVGACGIVGTATTHGFRKLGHKVVEHDTKLRTHIDILEGCSQVYICVPTPMKVDGSCDTSIVEDVIHDLAKSRVERIIVIKSTVSPGTTERMQKRYKHTTLCFVPEHLRQRSAIVDFCENNRILIVGTKSEKVFTEVVKAHGHLPKKSKMVDPTAAEISKLIHNLLAGLRIVAANEFYDICEAAGVNYTEVKECIVDSTGLPDAYLDVNSEFARGYSSLCLNKDLPALIAYAGNLGVEIPLIRTVPIANDRYAKTPF